MSVKDRCFQCEDENNLFEKGKSKHYIIFVNGRELEFCSFECKNNWKNEINLKFTIEFESEE